jgi:uncharacterized protein (DUF1015 family)
MAEIRPFQAYRYNAQRVSPADVTTQPYDKITPAMQEHYYAASPYNLIAVEKGRTSPEDSPENNVYTRAASKIKEWISAQILVQDPAPAIYAYAQDYTVPGTNSHRVRRGFIALGRVEDYEAGVIFRHEHTHSGPKADRLELLRHTHVQTGLLFMLFDDPTKQIDSMLDAIGHTTATVELKDEYGVAHHLWAITDPASIKRISNAMATQKLVIADGHHRYETALAFRNECREHAASKNPDAPYEFAMMACFNTHGSGLTILPTHRLIHNVAGFDFEKFREKAAKYFDWYGYPFETADERASAYAEYQHDFNIQHQRHGVGIYVGGNAFFLFLLRRGLDLAQVLSGVPEAQRELDVVLLHRLLLERSLGITPESVTAGEHITYERDAAQALAAVDRKEAQMACLLRAVGVQQVAQIALGGGVMPQKSTDFYPKLLSGLVIYKIDTGA